MSNWNSKSIKYTHNGYFNLKGYLKLMGLDPHTRDGLAIITAPRDMGKSYGTWEYIDNEIWKKYNFTRKIIYMRTNQEKTKEARATFNAKYSPNYICVGSIIYKLPEEVINENEIKKLRKINRPNNKWIEIGRIVDIMNEHNFRSGVGSFENYHFAFWDEFNETNMIDRGLYEKFIMLFSTISRQNKPFFMLIVGNKIQANNDIFTSFELDTNHDYTKDFIQYIEDDIVYVDIGIDTFKHLNPPEKMVNRLAKYNINTDNVFNVGGFMVSLPKNIIYRSALGNRELINYFTFRGNIYEYGYFYRGKKLCYYINLILEKDIDKKYRVISLDLISHINNKIALNLDGKDEYIYLAEKLTKQQKLGVLYFTSFDAKNDLELTLIRLLNFFEYNK